MTGSELRNIRTQDLGLSQEKLAEKMGVARATINRWENGRAHISKATAAFILALKREKSAA